MRHPSRIVAALLSLLLAGVLGLAHLFLGLADLSDRACAVPVKAAPPPATAPADLCVLTPSDQHTVPLLERELVRQAVLIAARDELGLRTRDGGLRETEGGPGVARGLSVRLGTSGFELSRPDPGKPPLKETLPLLVIGEDRVADLAREAEAASRGPFVEQLTRLGFVKQPAGGPGSAASAAWAKQPPPELTERFDLVSQFAAARAWHAAIRMGGDSPERLAGLARAYANLGLLSEHHWSVEPKVFRARSLLYAERLLHLTGETATTLRVRAYTRVLAGLPKAGGADLARAKDVGGDEVPPGWAAVLDARCRGDEEALDRICDADGGGRAFARLVRLSLAEATGSVLKTQQAAAAMLEVEPGCARALATLLGPAMPLGTSGAAQDAALGSAAAWLYEPLTRSRLPIPIAVSAVRKNPEEEGEFREKLLADLAAESRYLGDDGEPSLPAFGRVVEEEGFYQAWRVVAVNRDQYGVSADDLLARVRSWMPRHPLRAFVESYAWDDRKSDEAITALRGVYRYADSTIAVWPMRERLGPNLAWDRITDANFKRGLDDIAPDLAWRAAHGERRAGRREFARRLERVDPESPATAVLLLRYDGVRAAARLPEWERRFSRDPAVLSASAEWHIERERYDDATRCLRAAADVSPEYAVLKRLAEVRLAAGDEAGFVGALEEVMRNPAFGLEHAAAAQEIARHYMRRGRWKNALPWADRAAGSYSGWGMQRAAECREALGDYAGAEELYRAVSERYRASEHDWYFWCLRTGRGHVASARRAAEPAFAAWKQYPATDRYGYARNRAALAYLEGRPEEALDRWMEALEGTKDGYDAMSAALVADELGRGEVRDGLLRRAIASGYYVAGILGRRMLDGGAALDADDAARSAYRGLAGGAGAATDVQYFVGRFLESHGRADEADRWYGLAASSPVPERHCSLFASKALLRRGRDLPARRADEVDPATTEALRLYLDAVSYLGADKVIAARPRLDRTLSLLPGHVGALRRRCDVLLASGRPREALADVEAAQLLLPDSEDFLAAQCRTLECLGRYPEAVVGYETLVAGARDSAAAYRYHLDLASIYATCEDASVLDSAAAIRHLEAVHPAAADGDENEWIIRARIRSAAIAAGGNIVEALKLVSDQPAQAPAAYRPALEYQIACYREGKPYVRPPRWWMLFDDSDAAEESLAALGAEGSVEAPKPSAATSNRPQ